MAVNMLGGVGLFFCASLLAHILVEVGVPTSQTGVSSRSVTFRSRPERFAAEVAMTLEFKVGSRFSAMSVFVFLERYCLLPQTCKGTKQYFCPSKRPSNMDSTSAFHKELSQMFTEFHQRIFSDFCFRPLTPPNAEAVDPETPEETALRLRHLQNAQRLKLKSRCFFYVVFV